MFGEGITPPADTRPVTVESPQDYKPDYQQSLGGEFVEVYTNQKQTVRAWWDGMEKSTRKTLMIVAGSGAFIGLVAGLIYPYQIAAFQSALIGSMLFMFGCNGLLKLYAPGLSDWLPQNPRATLVLLGLITLLGALVQWTVLKTKTDS